MDDFQKKISSTTDVGYLKDLLYLWKKFLEDVEDDSSRNLIEDKLTVIKNRIAHLNG